jgi:alanine dehydrogenase
MRQGKAFKILSLNSSVKMLIGVPKETKDNEFRVGLTPDAVRSLCSSGHSVFVEKDAGTKSGFPDSEYSQAGAKLASAREAWDCDIVIKVKEPLHSEYSLLKPGSILFTYLHLAGTDNTLTKILLEKKISGIAYETVEAPDGSLSLLIPMSEVAGQMAPIIGAYYLGLPSGGSGLLPTRVTGVEPANVCIIGCGNVGMNAARISSWLGCRVTVLDMVPAKIEEAKRLGKNVATLLSTPENISRAVKDADILIGAVLVKGARAPKVVTREMVKTMKKGSVIVDVAIDQGGCVETSHPTTHSNPTFIEEGIVHYCVTNMPGRYAKTSTKALVAATLPYTSSIAREGLEKALKKDKGLAKGLNTYKGFITYMQVADSLAMQEKYRNPESLL